MTKVSLVYLYPKLVYNTNKLLDLRYKNRQQLDTNTVNTIRSLAIQKKQRGCRGGVGRKRNEVSNLKYVTNDNSSTINNIKHI
jgi:hypothetical protein